MPAIEMMGRARHAFRFDMLDARRRRRFRAIIAAHADVMSSMPHARALRADAA